MDGQTDRDRETDEWRNRGLLIIMIIYHDFLPTPRRGSDVKSDKTHTVMKIQFLAHILDT